MSAPTHNSRGYVFRRNEDGSGPGRVWLLVRTQYPAFDMRPDTTWEIPLDSKERRAVETEDGRAIRKIILDAVRAGMLPKQTP